MERFSLTLKGEALGVEVPETQVVEAQDTQGAEEKAKKQSTLENPRLERIEKLSFLNPERR